MPCINNIILIKNSKVRSHLAWSTYGSQSQGEWGIKIKGWVGWELFCPQMSSFLGGNRKKNKGWVGGAFSSP